MNIVLCGSMKVKDKIFEVEEKLKEKGFNVLLPEECIQGLPKKIASRAHLDRVIDANNPVILIVNAEKNGIQNYIGANTFAEIAFAYYFNKKVYLYDDIYKPYKDELEGWEVIPLKKDLNNIS